MILRLVLVVLAGALCSVPEQVLGASEAPLVARQDLGALSGKVRLPAGVAAARWLEVPRTAVTRVPGPTDTVLYVVVSMDPPGWESWQRWLKPRASTDTRILSQELAQALLPPDALQKLSSTAEGRLVFQAQYEAPGLAGSRYVSYWVARIGRELLLVFGSR